MTFCNFPYFQVFERLSDDDKAKVQPVVGELSEPSFAIKNAFLEQLVNEVSDNPLQLAKHFQELI